MTALDRIGSRRDVLLLEKFDKAMSLFSRSSTAMLTACDDRGNKQDDRIGAAVDASSAASPGPVALELSDAQLLEADPIDANSSWEVSGVQLATQIVKLIGC